MPVCWQWGLILLLGCAGAELPHLTPALLSRLLLGSELPSAQRACPPEMDITSVLLPLSH